jgi:hypothetical protein
MGGLRKLRRQGPDRYEVEPLRGDPGGQDWEPQDWKLSTRIMEIAKPLTDNAVDHDSFEMIVETAVLCWNIALLPPDQQEEELRSLVRHVAKGSPRGLASEVEAWARLLLDRKKRLFGSDRRMVMEHTIERDGNDLRLLVVAALEPQ